MNRDFTLARLRDGGQVTPQVPPVQNSGSGGLEQKGVVAPQAPRPVSETPGQLPPGAGQVAPQAPPVSPSVPPGKR